MSPYWFGGVYAVRFAVCSLSRWSSYFATNAIAIVK